MTLDSLLHFDLEVLFVMIHVGLSGLSCARTLSLKACNSMTFQRICKLSVPEIDLRSKGYAYLLVNPAHAVAVFQYLLKRRKIFGGTRYIQYV